MCGFDRRINTQDVGAGKHRINLIPDHGAQSIDDRGIIISSANEDLFEITKGDPLSAKLVTTYRWGIKSRGADTEMQSRTKLTADASAVFVEPVFSRPGLP